MKETSKLSSLVIFLVIGFCFCQNYVQPEVDGYPAEGNFIYGHELCLRHNMQLPIPDTKEKNEKLIKFLEDKRFVGTWIGANDMAEEGKFRWIINGQAALNKNFIWHSKQPDNWKNNEHCLEMRKESGKWAWNDLECILKAPIVCEPQFDIDVRAQWDSNKCI